jgi:hypothetical protein
MRVCEVELEEAALIASVFEYISGTRGDLFCVPELSGACDLNVCIATSESLSAEERLTRHEAG